VIGLDDFSRQWQRWFPEDEEAKKKKPPPSRRWPVIWKVLAIIAGVIVLYIIFNIFKGIYTEWLWFDSLGYGSVYTTILKTKVLIFFVAAIIFCLLFLGNLVLATRLAPQTEAKFWPWALVSRIQKMLRWNVILGTVILSVIFGAVAQGNWLTILQFFNWQPFGITDPVFHNEIGFYVFSLPFWHAFRAWFIGALIVVFLATAATYVRFSPGVTGSASGNWSSLSGVWSLVPATPMSMPRCLLSGSSWYW
jgi:uncharacterized membrane protein (UPF0182 family)